MAFAKAYGYIKYFHPSDEAALLDWDLFAVHSSEQVLKSSDLQKTLETLFLPIAPAIHFHEIGDKSISKIGLNTGDESLPDIYWQHVGNGKGSVGPFYKSARVNRPARVLPNSRNDFGSIRKNISITKLAGKEITYSAMIRPGATFTGRAYLEIRFKKENSDWKSLTSSGQSIEKNRWNQHSISTLIPKHLERGIIYVVNVSQSGSVDYDEIELKYKEDGEWYDLALSNSNFDMPDSLDTDWSPRGANQEFNVLKKGSNTFLRVSRTKGHFQNIPPIFETNTLAEKTLTKNIGAGITIKFPIVLKGNEQTTFPKTNEKTYENLLTQLDSISSRNLHLENPYVRLTNIINVWNTFQHFFPYFEQTNIDWETQFYRAIEKNNSDNTVDDHLNTLKQMVAPLNDSHIGVYYFSPDFFPPIQWELIEDKLVITKVLDNTLPLRPGDVVTKVSDQDWAVHWNNAYNKSPGATKTRRNFKAINESLKGEENSSITIEVEGPQKNSSLTLKRTINDDNYDRLLAEGQKVFKEVEPNVFYVNLSEITWEDLQNHIPKLSKSIGVIFDLRGYPSWGTMGVVSHFIHDSIEPVRLFTPHLLYPDREQVSFQKTNSSWTQPMEPFISAEKVFLTNGSAISYSETFLNLIEFYDLADIVGEQTAGTTGYTNNIHLLGGITIPWTGMKVLRQDNSIFHGRGVIPNHPVEKTIEGIKTGRDEYFEYALKLINE